MIAGGENGQESIHNGLMALTDVALDDEFIVIHDGNRPLVSSDVISDALALCSKCGNAVAAIPCVEVVFESQNFAPSEKEIDRNKIIRTQTPHIYKYGDLIKAHKEAEKRNLKNTAATCVLMKELGKKTYFSTGSVLNFKIFFVEDCHTCVCCEHCVKIQVFVAFIIFWCCSRFVVSACSFACCVFAPGKFCYRERSLYGGLFFINPSRQVL